MALTPEERAEAEAAARRGNFAKNSQWAQMGAGYSKPTPVEANATQGNLNPFNPPATQQPGYQPMGQQGLLGMMNNYNMLNEQQKLDDVDMEQFQMPGFMRGMMGLLG